MLEPVRGNHVNGAVSGTSVQVDKVFGDIGIHTSLPRLAGPELTSILPPYEQLDHPVRGRDRVVAELADTIVHRRPPLLVLSGAGGYGKTTLALALLGAIQPVMTWWVDATSARALSQGLRELALATGASVGAVQAAWSGRRSPSQLMHGVLGSLARPWVLVVDGADDPSVLTTPPQGSTSTWMHALLHDQGTVVVTSRDSDRASWGACAQVVKVPLLPSSAASRVLQDLAPNAGTRAQAQRLAARLGRLPLALRHAGMALAQLSTGPRLSGFSRPRDFSSFAQVLDIQLDELITPHGRVRHSERDVLTRTWELSLDLLAECGREAARPLLRWLSQFASCPIPLWLLDWRVLQAIGPFDEFDARAVEGGLKGLVDVGLLIFHDDREHDHLASMVYLHRVVRDVNRHHTVASGDTEEYRKGVLLALGLATSALDPTQPDNRRVWSAMRRHCEEITTWATVADASSDSASALQRAAIVSRAGYFCQQVGLTSAGIRLWQHAHDTYDEHLGPTALDTLTTRRTIAWLRWHRGEHRTAVRELAAVYRGRCEAAGRTSAETIESRCDLAWTRVLGVGRRQRDAHEFFRIAASASREHGPGSPTIVMVRIHTVRALHALGDHQAADFELIGVLTVLDRLQTPYRGGPQWKDPFGRGEWKHGAVAELRCRLLELRAELLEDALSAEGNPVRPAGVDFALLPLAAQTPWAGGHMPNT